MAKRVLSDSDSGSDAAPKSKKKVPSKPSNAPSVPKLKKSTHPSWQEVSHPYARRCE